MGFLTFSKVWTKCLPFCNVIHFIHLRLKHVVNKKESGHFVLFLYLTLILINYKLLFEISGKKTVGKACNRWPEMLD